MKVLAVGGSGAVGTLVLPRLSARHSVTVFDQKEPAVPLPFVVGNTRDFGAVSAALAGHDVLVYMAMGATEKWGRPRNALSHFDVNVAGLYIALMAAHAAGIRHAVYTSSMSVYDRLADRTLDSEDIPPDAIDHYGLSKRLGEEVCRAAWPRWQISVNALRLCRPMAEAEWLLLKPPVIATEATDVARALDRAIVTRFRGFEAFTINGDAAGTRLSIAKARRMLGWEPEARRPSGA